MRITKKYINEISHKIIGCAIEVHKHLGPGLLESVYENCLIKELQLNNLKVISQINIPIEYKGLKLENILKLDLLVEDIIIVELKAVDKILPIHSAQLLTYLKLMKKSKGLLINFNSENISQNLISLVTEDFKKLNDE